MTSAVQSMNPTVLKNIKRDNIKLETYAELQEELKSFGMQSYGELILCLPGETKQSFLDAVERFLDAGAMRVSAHQLMLLHGAELADPDNRERFQFNTRWRVVARNIGDYTGEPVIEIEEMVVATPDISYDEYIELRVFHLLLTIFYYEGNLTEAFECARGGGATPFQVMRWMSDNAGQAPTELKEVLDAFVNESEEELFDSREACKEWARSNYDALVDGTLGGNLLSKYSMMGRFYTTQAALDFLEEAIRACTADVDDVALSTVMDYLRKVVLHVPFAETMDADTRWTTGLDVEAWAAEGYSRPLTDYAFEGPRTFAGQVPDDRQALIASKVETFGEHPSGLGKFTRTMFARDLRRSFSKEQPPSPS